MKFRARKAAAYFARLGARIAHLRKQQGITQVQLAEALGVSQQTTTAYEVGRRRIQVSTLPVIAQALGVTVETLVAEEASPPSAVRHRSCSSNSNACRPCPKPRERLKKSAAAIC